MDSPRLIDKWLSFEPFHEKITFAEREGGAEMESNKINVRGLEVVTDYLHEAAVHFGGFPSYLHHWY